MTSSPENKAKIIQEAYRVQYLMEDVRVSYKKDMSASLDGVTIDAKEGDISSLPRWVAKILIGQDAVEI